MTETVKLELWHSPEGRDQLVIGHRRILGPSFTGDSTPVREWHINKKWLSEAIEAI